MTLATLQPPRTNPGLAEARHVVLPEGIVSSGLPAVRATCAQVGLGLDPWQVGVARCILAKDAVGMYAADTVALSIPRQVGKTYLIAALVFADCIVHPGTTTVWTAHRFKVTRETFNALRTIALSPPLSAHVDPDDVFTAAGNECITFRNGSRIVFAARERGAIRGFAMVRRLVLDEAQILSDAAMSDLAPTMNQAENPQMILMGTPPKSSDPGETFTSLRTDALAGTSEGVVYVEFSADKNADMDDRQAWRQANPSYPKRTPTRAMLRLRKLLSDEDFAREALGMWGYASTHAVIDPDLWLSLGDERSEIDGPQAFAVDVSPDRSKASIAVAGSRADGLLHVEYIPSAAKGVGWVVDRLVELAEKWSPVAVVIDNAGPAASLIPEIEKRGVEVTTTSVREMGQACGAFYDAAVEKRLRHRKQPSLNAALGSARKRPLGDAWAWHRRDPSTDITPLVAATLALHGYTTRPDEKRRTGVAKFY